MGVALISGVGASIVAEFVDSSYTNTWQRPLLVCEFGDLPTDPAHDSHNDYYSYNEDDDHHGHAAEENHLLLVGEQGWLSGSSSRIVESELLRLQTFSLEQAVGSSVGGQTVEAAD